MRVGIVQVASPESESADERRARVADLIRSAPPADLFVLPELWPGGYFAFDSYDALAETDDGPTLGVMRSVAREVRAHIHVGSYVDAATSGTYRNTAAVVDPEGTVVNTYSKVHGFGYQSAERERLAPGDYVCVTDSPFGRIASTTCYDLRFPGLWQRLTDGGAELIFVPAAWPMARRDHWRLLTSARALETQSFVIACNAAGEQAGVRLAGASRVVGPWGDVLLELGDDEEIGFVDLDLAEVDRVRKEFPVLKDRLPNYHDIRLMGDPRE